MGSYNSYPVASMIMNYINFGASINLAQDCSVAT